MESLLLSVWLLAISSQLPTPTNASYYEPESKFECGITVSLPTVVLTE